MMKHWLVAAAAVMGLANHPADAEAIYKCSGFTSDYAIFKESKTFPKDDNTFGYAIGIIVGRYMTLSGDNFPGDDKKLSAFERDVVSACAASPNKEFEGVALSVDLAKSSSPDGYQKVALVDLKLDLASLKGKRIAVTGEAMIFADSLMLGSDEGIDLSPVQVETKKLPRDQRKLLLESCDRRCSVTIYGKVGTVMFGPGIIADRVKVD